MKVTLNGMEMAYVEGGYKYIFLKPYRQFKEDTVTRDNGDRLHIELYDNGVQIRTLISKTEVATIINRDVAVDTKDNKIYILENENTFIKHPDGSIEIKDSI
ncbi:MAG: hypothetical protein U9N81_09310 [Bacillota bacterium]|nr:hypothetical protein [Bacillota bacterium]